MLQTPTLQTPTLRQRDGRLLSAMCVALLLLAAPTISASPITFAVTGRITAVQDPTHVLDGTLVEAGRVDATYFVDLDDATGTTIVFGDGQTGRRVPASGSVIGGRYRTGSGSSGNVTFAEPCRPAIDCHHAAAYFLFLPLLSTDGFEQDFRMDLEGLNGSLFAPVPFWQRLDAFQTRGFSWTFVAGSGTARVEGVVTAHASVPTPATMWLLGTGLALAAVRRRCTKRA